MSCVIYRMTVIYNPNTAAKIKLETKTENKDGNNCCPLFCPRQHIFPSALTCMETEAPPSHQKSLCTDQMSWWGCE